MKKQKTNYFASILMIVFCTTLYSCDEAGTTVLQLSGNEQNLPDELKGLKVYSVAAGDYGYVKVAILNNKVNSTTNASGKTQESLILLDRSTNNQISVSQILLENDSIIVCRK